MRADYRYTLYRTWWNKTITRKRLCWVMLNPSTADENTDDATIRRVTRFSRDWGYTSLSVVNLFAARATDPTQLLQFDDPVGPKNDWYTLICMKQAEGVVFAWGSFSQPLLLPLMLQRIKFVCVTAEFTRHTPLCLGTTQSGAPKHPVRLAADTRPEEFDGGI